MGGMTSKTASISSLRKTTVDLKTGMTAVNPSENLPISMKMMDILFLRYNLIPQFGITQCGACHMPTSAKMNSSEDTPNLHALKQTSTTDASEPEGLSPMKKKKKKHYLLYSSSYEETLSHEGYWTNEE